MGQKPTRLPREAGGHSISTTRKCSGIADRKTSTDCRYAEERGNKSSSRKIKKREGTKTNATNQAPFASKKHTGTSVIISRLPQRRQEEATAHASVSARSHQQRENPGLLKTTETQRKDFFTNTAGRAADGNAKFFARDKGGYQIKEPVCSNVLNPAYGKNFPSRVRQTSVPTVKSRDHARSAHRKAKPDDARPLALLASYLRRLSTC